MHNSFSYQANVFKQSLAWAGFHEDLHVRLILRCVSITCIIEPRSCKLPLKKFISTMYTHPNMGYLYQLMEYFERSCKLQEVNPNNNLVVLSLKSRSLKCLIQSFPLCKCLQKIGMMQ